MFLHVLSRIYSSSTFYAQNPALEVIDQQKSVNVYLHINAHRERSAEEPFMRSILSHQEHLSPVLAHEHTSVQQAVGQGLSEKPCVRNCS